MEKYIPLVLAAVFIAVGVFVEDSITSASFQAVTPNLWLTYGLKGFVFVLWALGMFVIGATHHDYGQEELDFRYGGIVGAR